MKELRILPTLAIVLTNASAKDKLFPLNHLETIVSYKKSSKKIQKN